MGKNQCLFIYCLHSNGNFDYVAICDGSAQQSSLRIFVIFGRRSGQINLAVTASVCSMAGIKNALYFYPNMYKNVCRLVRQYGTVCKIDICVSTF